jgi:hypothetical protein
MPPRNPAKIRGATRPLFRHRTVITISPIRHQIRRSRWPLLPGGYSGAQQGRICLDAPRR